MQQWLGAATVDVFNLCVQAGVFVYCPPHSQMDIDKCVLQKDTYCRTQKCTWYIIKMSAQWSIDIARQCFSKPYSNYLFALIHMRRDEKGTTTTGQRKQQQLQREKERDRERERERRKKSPSQYNIRTSTYNSCNVQRGQFWWATNYKTTMYGCRT